MRLNNKGYIVSFGLLVLLILISTVIDQKIFGTGLFIIEKLTDDCDDCNKKNVNTNLGALTSQISAINSSLQGIKGRVGANEAKLVQEEREEWEEWERIGSFVFKDIWKSIVRCSLNAHSVKSKSKGNNKWSVRTKKGRTHSSNKQMV